MQLIQRPKMTRSGQSSKPVYKPEAPSLHRLQEIERGLIELIAQNESDAQTFKDAY